MSLTVLADISDSILDNRVIRTVKEWSDGLNKENLGSVSLFSFSEKPKRLIMRKGDRKKASEIKELPLNRHQTSLYDSVIEVCSKFLTIDAPQSIILISDGFDTNSSTSLSDLIKKAKDFPIPIYCIGLGAKINDETLKELSSSTGGIFTRSSGINDLRRSLETASETISNQYEVSYVTSLPESSNTVSLTVDVEGQTDTATIARETCSDIKGPVRLNIGDTVAPPNGTALVPVTIILNESEPSAFQFDVTWSSSRLSLEDVTAGTASVDAGKDVTFSFLNDSSARIIGAGINQNIINDGIVANLNFKLSPAFIDGSTFINCFNATTSDPEGVFLYTEEGDQGSITIGNSADVNQDGAVNVVDVQLMINHALGVGSSGSDMNGDGIINVQDVQIVINAALGLI